MTEDRSLRSDAICKDLFEYVPTTVIVAVARRACKMRFAYTVVYERRKYLLLVIFGNAVYCRKLLRTFFSAVSETAFNFSSTLKKLIITPFVFI